MSWLGTPFAFKGGGISGLVAVTDIAAGPTVLRDTDADGTPWEYSVQVTFENDGTLSYVRGIGADGDITAEWLTTYPDSVNAAKYEIACTETSQSGAATRTGDTSGAYFGLETNRVWSISSTTSADKDWVLAFTIRDKLSQTIQDTASLTLQLTDGFT